MSIEGGYQHEQFEGGVQSIPHAMAAELGDSVVLASPVTAVTQTRRRGRGDGCAEATVTARHVVLALPRALASGIRFDPPLPTDQALLIHQIPAGTELKIGGGLRRALLARRRHLGGHRGHRRRHRGHARHHATWPQRGGHGQRTAAGPRARKVAAMSREDRHALVLGMLRTRLGPKATSPVEILEQNWVEEQWTRGCSMGHFPTGVLTQYGPLLRQPVGRLHWAGTETAARPTAPWTERCARVSGWPRRSCSWRGEEPRLEAGEQFVRLPA